MPQTPPTPSPTLASRLHDSAHRGTLLQVEFDSYLRQVIPLDAPAVQITECKRAFFAGASAVLNVLLLIGDDTISEDLGVETIEAIRQEIQAYVATVGGRS